MNKKNSNQKIDTPVEDKKESPLQEPDSPDYPATSPVEDIYAKDKQEPDIDPENIDEIKEPNDASGVSNEKDFEEDESGDDLDVPGAELDDEAEATGSEDEENNYYSIGGDNHNNLDEDNGD
jgi:hypothetical protein